jgi:hypothetical protein
MPGGISNIFEVNGFQIKGRAVTYLGLMVAEVCKKTF